MAVKQEALLRSSIVAAFLNSTVAILLRCITFLLNAFVLRHVSGDVLGVINVRLLLYVDTILFVSREAIRKACLNKPSSSWQATVNLIWLSVPIGLTTSLILGYIWIFSLELPTGQLLVDQYVRAVAIMALSVLLELASEPFFVVGQVYMYVKLRSFVDMLGLMLRSGLMVAIVYSDNSVAVIGFAWAHLAATLAQYLTYWLYFRFKIVGQHPELSSSMLMFSLRDFHVDKERYMLAKSFFRQGFFKQLLTEGEKYMFTWFSLMSLTQQGVYDVVANLGSLAARLVFAKVEESAYLYFNQTVKRGEKSDDDGQDTSRHLKMILRAMTLLGLVILTFGYSYSHLLLHIYGGQVLSSGIGPSLLRGHCVFVLFMAINGVSECYSFALMTSQQVDQYNYLMAGMTLAFLACAWMLAQVFGPLGFIMANCSNFAMRIGHNMHVIHKRHSGDIVHPLKGLVPPGLTIVALIISGVVCQVSERTAYDCTSLYKVLLHVFIGALCFLATLIIIVWQEPQLVTALRRKFSKRKTA